MAKKPKVGGKFTRIPRTKKEDETKDKSPSQTEEQKAVARLQNLKKGSLAFELQERRIAKLQGRSFEEVIKERQSKESSKPTKATSKPQTQSDNELQAEIEKVTKQTLKEQRETIFRKQAEQKLVKSLKEQTQSGTTEVSTLRRSIGAELSRPEKEEFIETFIGQKEATVKGIKKVESLEDKAIQNILKGETQEQRDKIQAIEEAKLKKEVEQINISIQKEGQKRGNLAFTTALGKINKQKLEVLATRKRQTEQEEAKALEVTSSLRGTLFQASPEQLFIKAKSIVTDTGKEQKLNTLPEDIPKVKKFAFQSLGVVKAIGKGVKEKPLTTGLAVLGGVALTLIPEPVTTAGGLSLLGASFQVAGAGLTGVYAGVVASEVAKAPKGTRAETIGKVAQRDAPILVGLPLGLKLGKSLGIKISKPVVSFKESLKRKSTRPIQPELSKRSLTIDNKLKTFVGGLKEAPIKSTFIKQKLPTRVKEAFPSLDPLAVKTDSSLKFTGETTETFIPFAKTESGKVLSPTKFPQKEFGTIRVVTKPKGFDLPIVKRVTQKIPGGETFRVQVDPFAVTGKGGRQLQLVKTNFDPIKKQVIPKPEYTFFEKSKAEVQAGKQFILKTGNIIPERASRLLKLQGDLKPESDVPFFVKARADVLQGKQFQLKFKEKIIRVDKKGSLILDSNFKQRESQLFPDIFKGNINLGKLVVAEAKTIKPKGIKTKTDQSTNLILFGKPSEKTKSLSIQKIKTNIDQITESKIKSRSKLKVKPLTKKLQTQEAEAIIKVQPIADVTTKSKMIIKQKQGGKLEVPQVVITESISPQIIIPSLISSPISGPIKPPPFKPPTRPPPQKIFIPLKLKGKPSLSGFDVFVRKKGKFVKVTPKPLRRKEALEFGRFKVGTSASATFKLEESQSSNLGTFKGKGKKEDFYKSKDGFFIEKLGRRIKSQGELREITYKGIASRRKKGIVGLFK